jgi:epoxyqueuosine reductase
MKSAIRQRALELGFDACRFATAEPPANAAYLQRWLDAGRHGDMAYLQRNAQKRIDPQQVLPGANTIICLAVTYGAASSPRPSPPGEEREKVAGVIARYAQYADYHDVIAERIKTLTEYVNELAGVNARSLWYVDTGPLLERELAQRAGLGFVGKHTNLISRELGNWFFLAEIITTAELEPDMPEPNRCGTCSACIDACPTRAITAPFQLDARRCISYLTIELKGAIPEELRPAIGNRIYGCDDCLAACPWNRFAAEANLMRPHFRPELAAPDLIELLSLSEADFKTRFAGTPMLRTKRRGILRNVCVGLGNIGDERALPALETAASDPEPLIREHATWAIGQIQDRLSRGAAPSAVPQP